MNLWYYNDFMQVYYIIFRQKNNQVLFNIIYFSMIFGWFL